SLFAQNFSNGFEFYLPPYDSSAQRFMPEFPRQAIEDYVTIGPDGHFTSGGQPIRFWGMNMAYGACFPDKDKAPKIAARLRKMGVNLVRFTLMDSPWTDEEGTIFFGETTTQVLNFFNLDRLHFFVAELKKQGIYVDIVLHDTRTFKEGDGVLHADSIPQTAKAVNMFDRQMIALQKSYALQLLSPVNVYTGLSLAEDPVVAMIEITNENTLYGYWKSGWLRHFSEGGELTMRHVDTLDARWNAFLQTKYASQTELENTWNQSAGTGGQNDQVADGGFESGDPAANFSIELHDVAQATLTADADNPYEGQYCARVDVLNVTGTSWHIQFKQTGASLQVFKAYEISFAARCDGQRTIEVVASRDNAPYTWYGSSEVSLTEDWQEFSFTFIAPEDNDGQFRLGFQFLNQEGSYWFDNISLTDAGVTGLLPGESLADGNIARISYPERGDYSPHRVADNAEFYLSLQSDYFDTMYDYLKNDLGVKAGISGSNTLSGISDLYTVRNMDYMNEQEIWDYVQYPNGWSPDDWWVENRPMVADGWSTMQPLFGGMAMKGKPFVVSGYTHSFPNRYQVEMIPWLTAYGSLHSADGLAFYYYNDEPDAWTSDRVDGFYTLHRNTAIMALSPVYAQAYRQGLIAPAGQVYELEYSLPYLRALPLTDNSGRWGKFFPYDSRLAYMHDLRAGFDGTGLPDLDQLPPAPEDAFISDTEETTLDFEKGILKTIAPRFVSVCGALDENEVTAGPLTVKAANGFGAIGWLSLSDGPLSQSDESVLVVSSKVQNTGMVWDGVHTFHENWGSQPTQMFPLQLAIELQLDADYLQVYPLSETGAGGQPKIVTPTEPGVFVLSIDQSQEPTVWFGIEALTGTPAPETDKAEGIAIFPNPSIGSFLVSWPQASGMERLSLVSSGGRLLYTQEVKGYNSWKMSVPDLPEGVYFLKLRGREKVMVRKVVIQ
ncbi:MAG TPA: T9SS type A sorting domain-containing protein, partial [Bacteroidetes bacterium]|nr:T9SS type A sorting domain-containing protein [Bacteroidota bacterium]